MKITAMRRWQPRPGAAIGWRPTTRCADAAADAPPTGRPLTFLTENHVRSSQMARANGQPHRSYLGSGTELDGDLDVEAMTAALEAFVRRHPILRSWFTCADGAIRHHLVAPEDVAFVSESLGSIDDVDHLHQHLCDRFGAETISDAFPGFAFGAVAHDGGFAIYFGCDHALSDGASQALALTEIADLYTGIVDGSADLDGGSDDSYFDHAELDAMSAGHHMNSPEADAWRNTFSRNGLRMPGFPLDLGIAPGETAPVRPLEMSMLDRAGVASFDAVCKAAGGSFLSGIHAAMAIAGYELGGSTYHYGMIVSNTRAMHPDFAGAQGWFCSFAPVEVDIATATEFTSLIPAAYTAQQESKRLATVPVQAAMAAMVAAGAPDTAVVTAPNLLSYIDFRWFPGNGKPAFDRGVIFTGEGRTANASVWINRDHDSLYLGSQTPDTPFAQRQVRRYFDRLCAVVADVARHGDHVISPPVDADALRRIDVRPQERALARHDH
ncbi:condensation domain-containing protein [Gordonia sp. LSe1-13]|uniref:Condensation domain-containing protein n=1 Tax=Gordonia sesuvii TaxID=3116777 RepID=A0ABU7M9C1_9ACTN|nr:condensation domain-containing protein [Gordonia sp. LSe1-13]